MRDRTDPPFLTATLEQRDGVWRGEAADSLGLRGAVRLTPVERDGAVLRMRLEVWRGARPEHERIDGLDDPATGLPLP